MAVKYLIIVLILSPICFWLLAVFIPAQAVLFFLLRDITFGFLILIGGIFLGIAFMMFNQYNGIDYKLLKRENFELTLSDGIMIHGAILTTDSQDDSSPVVLACHGWRMSMEKLNQVVYPLVVQGYKVVYYNHRGHGKKPFKSGGNKSEIDKTFMDVQQIVDFIVKRPDLNHEKLAAVGFSLGGGTLLTGGYTDERIKLVMAFSATHDWLETTHWWSWYIRLGFRLTGLIIFPSDELNRKLSPKYYLDKKKEGKVVCLAHAKNDRIVPFEGFLKNKELLNLPDEQTIVFEQGDHGFMGQNTVYVSQIIKWLNDYL